ncbi:MAG: class I SAM-dependent methyltransferase [Oscillospiraceae bacterium]|nr:class I SAM-dependent methyltransferase [Oscillospiraceae bacterium]
MISLDSRLRTVAELCRKGTIVADVGTDHALLACYLAQNGAREVIASDIREGPLAAARRTVEQTGVKNVRVTLSDGLKAIDFAEDVVICGMGGELIADIVEDCGFITENTRFILQPMTKPDILRRRLYSSGFEIIEERTAYEGSRGYAIMLVKHIGIPRETDEIFELTGKITDPKFLRLIAEKLLKNAHGMDRSEDFRESAEHLRRNADIIFKKAEGLI